MTALVLWRGRWQAYACIVLGRIGSDYTVVLTGKGPAAIHFSWGPTTVCAHDLFQNYRSATAEKERRNAEIHH